MKCKRTQISFVAYDVFKRKQEEKREKNRLLQFLNKCRNGGEQSHNEPKNTTTGKKTHAVK